MRTIEIDREGECDFRVTWMQGAQSPKSRLFDSRDAAEIFAHGKMGVAGCVISTLDMSAEQLAANAARKARAANFLAGLQAERSEARGLARMAGDMKA